nr:hypothetical protein [Tanacetum cinerariifolium]
MVFNSPYYLYEELASPKANGSCAPIIEDWVSDSEEEDMPQEKDAEVEGRHADKQAELYNLDQDHSSKVLSMQEYDTEVQEAIEIVTTSKL